MKRKAVFGSVLMLLMVTLLTVPLNLQAQEEESNSPFSVGADLVSSYVWRGTKYGKGPALQPNIEFSAGGFSIGGWGSYDFNENAEADLYMSYGFDFGLSVGLTDYYYPGAAPYFDYSSPDGSHGFEVNLGYEIGGLALSANYMINEASGAGTAGSDLYFEAGYTFSYFGIFVGAGDGWHTSDGEFMVCNIGLSASKEISIGEKFSLPLSAAVILNPETEQFNIVATISF